jgi:magnesium and cobalt transporter
MSEDPSSTGAPARSWFGRLTDALSGEPRNREELIEALQSAQAKGLLSLDTLKMIEGAIAVSEQEVGDVMVPRAQMVSIDIEAPLDEVRRTVVESGHSRFPVHGEDKDEILGILLAKDLLRGLADGSTPPLRELLRPAVLIPESKRLNVLLKEFRLSRNHMAIVVDEYGGVAGLVTIEDLLEQIVGEIDDEHDDAPEEACLITSLPDGRFLVDALTPIALFNERFGSEFSDEEYDTIGGLVIAALGHLPEGDEETNLGRFHFRVAKAEHRRVQAFLLAVGNEAE